MKILSITDVERNYIEIFYISLIALNTLNLTDKVHLQHCANDANVVTITKQLSSS